MDIVLSKRMETVVNMVLPQSAVIKHQSSLSIADVGCDHAYVSIALIQRKIAKKVIAMDVRQGPLAIAQRNVSQYGLESEIELRLSDGLEKLSVNEVDVIIIAGMGGLLITGILERGKHVVPRPTLVLQPQSELREVRKYLAENSYQIEQERALFEEGKYYTVIRAVPMEQGKGKESSNFDGKQYCAEEEKEVTLLYGAYGLKNKDACLFQYLIQEEHKLKEILCKLKKEIKCAKETGKDISAKTIERQEMLQRNLHYNMLAKEYWNEE